MPPVPHITEQLRAIELMLNLAERCSVGSLKIKAPLIAGLGSVADFWSRDFRLANPTTIRC